MVNPIDYYSSSAEESTMNNHHFYDTTKHLRMNNTGKSKFANYLNESNGSFEYKRNSSLLKKSKYGVGASKQQQQQQQQHQDNIMLHKLMQQQYLLKYSNNIR
jgi:hypothetical protein